MPNRSQATPRPYVSKSLNKDARRKRIITLSIKSINSQMLYNVSKQFHLILRSKLDHRCTIYKLQYDGNGYRAQNIISGSFQKTVYLKNNIRIFAIINERIIMGNFINITL